MKTSRLGLPTLAILAALSAKAAGATHDVALDFSTDSNPNGVWSYGYETSLGSDLILYTDKGNASGVDYWVYNISAGTPSVAHNPTGNTISLGTPSLAAGQASFHPGPNNQYSVYRFMAPNPGSYRLDAAFTGVDLVGTTTDVHVLLNGVSLFAGAVSGFGPGSGPSFGTNVVLHAGDRVDFAVGYGNGAFQSDGTGIAARLTGGGPPLEIRPLANGQLEVSWPADASDYIVEAAFEFPSTAWTGLGFAPTLRDDRLFITIDAVASERFFRLRGP